MLDTLIPSFTFCNESFFKKVQTNFSTEGKKANDMFWHFYCFLIINTSKGVNGERYRAASAARQKNKFCPNYFGAFTQNFLEIERSDAQIHDF